MKLADIHSVYFVGIGGIGMSALARWFHAQGCEVAGYDTTRGPITGRLEALGIPVTYSDQPENLQPAFTKAGKDVLVVYTPAVPESLGLLQYFRKNEFTVLKRAAVLGVISKNYYTLAVAGTHGKTSTSSMLAHILTHAGKSCMAFLGGISKNYQSNFVHYEAEGKPMLVAEADEFDRSFLQLEPNITIVTSVDPDHLDIYGDFENMKATFAEFANLMEDDGHLVIQEQASELLNHRLNVKAVTYGISEGEAQARNIRVEHDKGMARFVFDLHYNKGIIPNIALTAPGRFNVLNACAAALAALEAGVEGTAIRKALNNYEGVWRRFEYIVQPEAPEQGIYIDDYAHHPTEIAAVIDAIRHLYPTRKLTAVFQPHLYSRTRDFAEGFARELSKVDELYLLPVYPAREQPIEGVDSSMLLNRVTLSNRRLLSKKDFLEAMRTSNQLDVLLSIGAGDIDRLVPELKEIVEEKNKQKT